MNDMIYAAENYFDNPSYLRIDDRPVMFIYNLRFIYDTLNTTVAQGLFDDLLQRMSVYFVGDVGSGPSPPNADSPLLYSMDAVTSYFFAHVYTSEGWENVTECAKRYYPEWRSVMNSNGTRFIPNAYPGYDNTEYCKWKNDSSKPIVLLLNETMFKEMLTIALDYANDDLKIIMITSWNEWLESTAIEPSMEFGELFLHTVLNARRIQQPCSIICAVFYFAVGAASGVVVIIILCYKKSLRKIK
jgi:hypothetical protein